MSWAQGVRSEEHTSELQSLRHLVCRLLLETSGDHRDLHSFPTRLSSDLRLNRQSPQVVESIDAQMRGSTCLGRRGSGVQIAPPRPSVTNRSEEHTSELQSLR